MPEIRAALSDWVTTARRRFHLEEVHLFGSFARGNPHEGSDIDLVLIGPFTGKLPYRIESVLLTTDLPIQPLCYTRDEWQAMVAAGNPLALEVLRGGRTL
ncbi:MAG: nucleotidyltransferase domain-containing protein [Thermoanaerobaculia bacterium]